MYDFSNGDYGIEFDGKNRIFDEDEDYLEDWIVSPWKKLYAKERIKIKNYLSKHYYDKSYIGEYLEEILTSSNGDYEDGMKIIGEPHFEFPIMEFPSVTYHLVFTDTRKQIPWLIDKVVADFHHYYNSGDYHLYPEILGAKIKPPK